MTYAILETNLRFESASGILGAKINFEKNLGMDKYRVMPMLNARFNVRGRYNIFALYYGLPRDAYYVTKRDIEFGNRFIAAGTEVFSYFNTNVYSLGYMYDAVSDARSHLGLFSLFFLSIDDYAGSIHTLGAQMDFYLTRWLELGLGYYLFDLNLEVSKTQFTGLFDYLYQGPYLSAGFRF